MKIRRRQPGSRAIAPRRYVGRTDSSLQQSADLFSPTGGVDIRIGSDTPVAQITGTAHGGKERYFAGIG
jgi:hypothetical protein